MSVISRSLERGLGPQEDWHFRDFDRNHLIVKNYFISSSCDLFPHLLNLLVTPGVRCSVSKISTLISLQGVHHFNPKKQKAGWFHLFSHPWNGVGTGCKPKSDLRRSLCSIWCLNSPLIEELYIEYNTPWDQITSSVNGDQVMCMCLKVR